MPSTPQPPSQPDAAAIPHDDFDAHLFWEQHKNKIIVASALLLAALVIFGVYQSTTEHRATAAGALLTRANSAEDYRQVIAQYPRTVAAGNAHLLLAKQLREEKKLDEAAGTLRDFTQKFPEHPLVHAGWLSLAETLEAQGKTEEAVSAYQQVAAKYPESYSAPLAVLAQANLLKTGGKPDEARRIYENFIAQFPESTFTQEAMREMRMLRK